MLITCSAAQDRRRGQQARKTGVHCQLFRAEETAVGQHESATCKLGFTIRTAPDVPKLLTLVAPLQPNFLAVGTVKLLRTRPSAVEACSFIALQRERRSTAQTTKVRASPAIERSECE